MSNVGVFNGCSGGCTDEARLSKGGGGAAVVDGAFFIIGGAGFAAEEAFLINNGVSVFAPGLPLLGVGRIFSRRSVCTCAARAACDPHNAGSPCCG